eukprot:6773906-Heterocapsa_arctica.AAC.1
MVDSVTLARWLITEAHSWKAAVPAPKKFQSAFVRPISRGAPWAESGILARSRCRPVSCYFKPQSWPLCYRDLLLWIFPRLMSLVWRHSSA